MTQKPPQNTENHDEESAALSNSTIVECAVSASEMSYDSQRPSHPEASPWLSHLTDLTDRARGYVEAANAVNTSKAYAADWKHFSAWCRRSNLTPLPPHPQTVGLYITACASGAA